MTVWLVNPIADDVSPSAQYGELRVIGRRYVYGDEIVDGELPAFVIHGLTAAVKEFQSAGDYLLLAGDHLQLVVMSAMLMRLHGTFQVLRWDKHAKGYYVVRVPDVKSTILA